MYEDLKNTSMFIEIEEIKCTENEFISYFEGFLNQDDILSLKH